MKQMKQMQQMIKNKKLLYGVLAVIVLVVGAVLLKTLVSLSKPSRAPDTAPPIIYDLKPAGNLPNGTKEVTISFKTNERARCGGSTTPGVIGDPNAVEFTSVRGVDHSYLISGFKNDSTYTGYIRCMDTAGNVNTEDFVVQFSVGKANISPVPSSALLPISPRPFLSGNSIDAARYLNIVRSYADTMIKNGRDTYGQISSPLFASALDRNTLKLPVNLPPDIEGIRNWDRAPTGANPMHDENLYQALYGLTAATGEAKYRAAADESLTWFFNNTQSPVTGFFAWGEHLSWDFKKEEPISGGGYEGAYKKRIHEFYRPWVLWKQSFALAPEASRKFALGIWNHQIANQTTGDFSRHADYDRHAPGKGFQFARHGGFYIAAWAWAYNQTQDPQFLKAIEALVDSFENRRAQDWGEYVPSGAIPFQTKPNIHPVTKKEIYVWSPTNSMSYAIDVQYAAKLVPADLAGKLRSSAAKTDQVYLNNIDDWYQSVAKFEVSRSNWKDGYGGSGHTYAKEALLHLERYRQTNLDGYKTRFLATANDYLNTEPNIAELVYPGVLGDAILMETAAYTMTGDTKYLDRADYFAQIAISAFFNDSSGLPRASTQHNHYEAITRGDTLVMALLDLWAAKTNPNLDLGLALDDR